MPIAFFTRTQTGALQSRLNNDVVGAQQAVTNTLGTVLQNVISLVVTLVDHVPAQLADHAAHAGRAPGLHLPGAPARTAHPEARAHRHAGERGDEQHHRGTLQRRGRDARQAVRPSRPGTRRRSPSARAASATSASPPRSTAASCWSCSGSSPRSAPPSCTSSAATSRSRAPSPRERSRRSPRTSRSIYQPLAQLTNSRVDVLTALVSFERVFEVIDFPAAITDRPGAVDLVDPEGRIELDHVWFRHPAGREVSLESLEAPGTPGARRAERLDAARRLARVEPGATVALVGASGAGKTTIAMLVPRVADDGRGLGAHRRPRRPRPHARVGARRDRAGAAGPAPLPRHHPRQPALRATRTPPTPSCARRSNGPASGTSSRRCPTVSTPSSANAATGCRAARSSASRSPGSC